MSFTPLLFTALLFQSIAMGDLPQRGDRNANEGGLLPMLIYFHSDQCAPCAEFDALFAEPEILLKLEQHYVAARVNIDNLEGKACADIYDIESVPALVVADHKGIILYRSDENLSLGEITTLIDALPGPYPVVPATLQTAIESTGTPMVIDETRTTVSRFVTDPVALIEPRAIFVSYTSSASDYVGGRQVQVSPVAHSRSYSREDITGEEDLVADVNANPIKVIESSPAKTTNASSAYRTSSRYSVQLGYFSMSTYAESLQQKAQAKGLTNSRVKEEVQNNKTFYRLLVGEFSSLSDAQNLLERVRSLGFKGAIYRP